MAYLNLLCFFIAEEVLIGYGKFGKIIYPIRIQSPKIVNLYGGASITLFFCGLQLGEKKRKSCFFTVSTISFECLSYPLESLLKVLIMYFLFKEVFETASRALYHVFFPQRGTRDGISRSLSCAFQSKRYSRRYLEVFIMCFSLKEVLECFPVCMKFKNGISLKLLFNHF